MCQMKRRGFLHSAAGLLGGGLIAHPAGHAQNAAASTVRHVHAISLMTESATRFLAALDDNQRVKATFQFTDEERSNWFYVPIERKGLPLREMSAYQKHLATALLASGLSQAAMIKAVTIMSLEDVLKNLEHDSGERRNPEKYYFSIFGTPSESGTWGWRVEGHHISQNFTVTNGVVVDGPSFFGSNPAKVLQGPRAGLRVLAPEDDMGFEFLRTLNEPLLKAAIVDAKAYSDILTANKRKAALDGQPSGLSAANMSPRQFEALRVLSELYARNLSDEAAARRIEQIDKAGRNMFFAWAGGTNPGDPHYYRIQTPAFLIEFDMTQDNANHIHSVWRDLTADFGGDLLKGHYDESHKG